MCALDQGIYLQLYFLPISTKYNAAVMLQNKGVEGSECLEEGVP